MEEYRESLERAYDEQEALSAKMRDLRQRMKFAVRHARRTTRGGLEAKVAAEQAVIDRFEAQIDKLDLEGEYLSADIWNLERILGIEEEDY